MATSKKLEKALYGPSITEVALGAILGLLVGVLAAVVFLVFKPVKQLPAMPKTEEVQRSMVYYVPGTNNSAKTKGWQAKQKQFLAGTSISVVEDELNAWVAGGGVGAPSAPAVAKPPAKKPADKPKADDKGSAKSDAPALEGFVIPGTPNFRIVGDKLQIGMKCTLNWYGLAYETTVVTTGTFKKSGDSVVFSPETVYLGSCPLHLLPAAGGQLITTLISKQKVSDELRTAWTKLTGVTIEGGAVKFAMQ
ncbi:MAG: hypothetical protein JWQ83_247 [Lacunisphaera sp.]|nr:hypothetical protein [Lacunisphaera sp.]MDB6165107.1 hypothetical protein [Lacunisphaera sp.]